MSNKNPVQNLVSNRIYNWVINSLIIVSILYIVFERFINISPLSYEVLMNIDYCILALFLVDFILRAIGGGKKYLIQDYGWVDLLAVTPLLLPAFSIAKSLRIVRVARFLRLMRIFRLIKLVRASDRLAAEKQKVTLPVVTLVMLLVIIGGSFMINGMNILMERENQNKLQAILDDADFRPSDQSLKDYLLEQEGVLEVKSSKDLINEQKQGLLTRIRRGDTITASVRTLHVVYSTQASRRSIDILEGFLYIFVFISVGAVQLMLSIKIDQAFLKKE